MKFINNLINFFSSKKFKPFIHSEDKNDSDDDFKEYATPNKNYSEPNEKKDEVSCISYNKYKQLK